MNNTDEALGLYRTSNSIAEERARFMSRVYSWMTAGISVSGGIAYFVGSTPELVYTIVSNRLLFWCLIIAQLGSVFYLSMAVQKISSKTAAAVYLLYAALTGLTLSVIFMLYTQASIASVFGLTAFSFAGLSLFGSVTKRDLGPVGSFCTMGLFGMIGFGLLSIFFPDMLGGVAEQVYAAVGIVVFSGLTAYDTQKIKTMYALGSEGTDTGRKGAIYGALTLYLDFINLFLSLLRLFGKKR